MTISKRILLPAVALLALLLSSPLFAADPFHINAKAAILMELPSGRILYAQDPDTPIGPASITKVLTLYLADEAIRDGKAHPADLVRVSKKAGHTGGSRMFIQTGAEIPLSELLTGVAVVSANDAAVAVAEYLGGDVDTFVAQMNRKARELGMSRSVFKNPNGLPAQGQVTTARDMLVLSRDYLRCFPESLHLHSQQFFTYRDITQHNRNALLTRYPNVDGIKTGWIQKAGYHIIATAKRGGTRLIAVVMGAKNPNIRTRETEKLLDYGFSMAPKLQG